MRTPIRSYQKADALPLTTYNVTNPEKDRPSCAMAAESVCNDFRFRFPSPSQLIALHQSRFRVNEQKTGMEKT